MGIFKTLLATAIVGAGLVGVAHAEEEVRPGPAIWKMTDDNSTLYLFGTFHFLTEGIEWQTDLYREAMNDAEITITEVDTKSPEAQAAVAGAIQLYGLNPAGTTLSSTLGEERAAAFAEVAGQFGIPMPALEFYKPWLASLSVTISALQSIGFDPKLGVEEVVLGQAGLEGDEIDHLETPEEQIIAIASLDETEMLSNFDAGLDQFDQFEELTMRMMTSWQTGDLAALEKDIVGDFRNEAPDAFQKIFVERNENWVVVIKEIMAGEGDYFIAVGAGHLIGEDSVIDMLRDDGFEIDRVQ